MKEALQAFAFIYLCNFFTLLYSTMVRILSTHTHSHMYTHNCESLPVSSGQLPTFPQFAFFFFLLSHLNL